MKQYWSIAQVVILIFLFQSNFVLAQVKSEPYNWKSVQIVGGGFVDGIVFHPTEPHLRYCRTDMGGAYRWNEAEKRWMPLLDWVSYEDANLMGVESIALDPSNPNAVYLSCGTYTNPQTPNGAVLRSFDRGKTFERIDMPFKMGGNENGRGNGERMAVDPSNGNILFLGTRNDGLWSSTDRAKTWNRVASFPDVTENPPVGLSEQELRRWSWTGKGSGVIFAVFDRASASADGCKTIYVGVSLMNRPNLFRSDDGGQTWNPVAGQPTAYRPTHGVLASDGTFYISYGTNPGPNPMADGAVWKLDTKMGTWTDITPDKPDPEQDIRFGYAAVAVDASNSKALIASAFGRPWQRGGDELFRSVDGGESWKPVFKLGARFDYSIAPYVEFTPLHWLFDIEINPLNPDHAIFTTGFGGFETFNLTNVERDLPTTWSVYTRGVEETVPLELCSPPEGAHLITAIGDYAGFVHWNLDTAQPGAYFTDPYFGNTDGVTCAYLKPNVLVRVGIKSGHHKGESNIGYSTDFGRTWKPASNPTNTSKHGHIAVSANGETWVWTPQGQKPYRTADQGKTWTEIDLPQNVRIVADKVNPLKFHGIHLYQNKLYTSTDGACSFTATDLNLDKGIPERGARRADPRGGQDRIYTTPGIENDCWIAAFDGLYHSAKVGSAFSLKPHVSEIHAFGFGKEAPGAEYPALYLIGVVNGQRGIFRSTDQAQSWVRINDDQHQWGLLLHVTGDPKKYGRVYVGTHGRGALYGDPVE